MEFWITLSSVALVWGVAVVTPGPNFFLTVQTAIGGSRRSALFVVSGICTGTVLWAASGFLGIQALFGSAPWVYRGLKWIGGGYLVVLGLRLMGRRPGETAEHRLPDPSADGRWQSFRSGLLTNLSNPKTAAFMASLFAATMPRDPALSTGIGSVLLMAAISFGWYASVALIFSVQRFKEGYRKARTWIRRAAGAVFVGFGVKLITGD